MQNEWRERGERAEARAGVCERERGKAVMVMKELGSRMAAALGQDTGVALPGQEGEDEVGRVGLWLADVVEAVLSALSTTPSPHPAPPAPEGSEIMARLQAAIAENEMLQVELMMAQEETRGARKEGEAFRAERDALALKLRSIMGGAGGGGGEGGEESASVEDVRARAAAQRKAFQDALSERERALVDLRQTSTAQLDRKEAQIRRLTAQVEKAKKKIRALEGKRTKR